MEIKKGQTIGTNSKHSWYGRCMTTDECAAKIRDLRKRRGLTQRLLALQLGRTETTVGNWEQGRCRCPGSVRPLLARILGVQEAELEPGE